MQNAIIRPVPAVKVAERDSTPFQIETAMIIAINLNVHYDRTRLLDLADSSQFNLVAESGGNFAAWRIRTQITGGNARQHKENGRSSH